MNTLCPTLLSLPVILPYPDPFNPSGCLYLTLTLSSIGIHETPLVIPYLCILPYLYPFTSHPFVTLVWKLYHNLTPLKSLNKARLILSYSKCFFSIPTWFGSCRTLAGTTCFLTYLTLNSLLSCSSVNPLDLPFLPYVSIPSLCNPTYLNHLSSLPTWIHLHILPYQGPLWSHPPVNIFHVALP